ncbi:uracil-DNA glycosylase-like protein [Tricharina praecox]|uniref:uracil-DNA glycosylase-like protein n=1 Tax=Tricharina praecox TaxID=43433 RepID=UPI00221F7A82|nr:uracil-DNA glycosylase-like protein [Tricharina praecox]KAI5846815.1 uracil-DNA glycosylase-like protein [Tricharina praecox]
MSGNLKRKAPPTPSSTAKKTRSIASFFRPAASPSSSNSGSSTSSTNGSGDIATSTLPKFNKATWLSTLTPEQRTLLSLELSSIGPSYLGLLAPLLTTPQFLSLKAFLASERGPVYPPAPQIYTWTRLCPLPSVRVVVLGQDPYHGPGQAMGLSFSVSPPTPAPPSLGNIYKALARDYPDFRPPPGRGGDLSPWARRGVLLLNAALTVRRGEAASHAGKGWEKITGAVLSHLAKGRGCVFMVWGADAQKRVKEVGIDENKHLVLRSVHPSPLSAHRGWVSYLPTDVERGGVERVSANSGCSSIADTSRRRMSGLRRATVRRDRSIGVCTGVRRWGLRGRLRRWRTRRWRTRR